MSRVVQWSKERRAWQRDALRRIVISGELSDDDIDALAELCKSRHGLAEPREAAPISAEHVQDAGKGAPVSRLDSIIAASMRSRRIKRSSSYPR